MTETYQQRIIDIPVIGGEDMAISYRYGHRDARLAAAEIAAEADERIAELEAALIRVTAQFTDAQEYPTQGIRLAVEHARRAISGEGRP